MTKSDIISNVAEKAEITKKAAEAAVNAVFDSIVESLADGDKVQIAGFGSFEVKNRAARTCMNPVTKEKIQVPASKAPGFKAGKALKDAVAK